MRNEIKMSEWLTLLDGMNKPEAVPAGFKTAKEIALETGKSGQRTRELLLQGIEAGLVERQMFRAQTAGTIRPVPYYRIKKEAK